jgi:hypothetical protein
VAMAVKLIKNEMTSGMDPITEENSSITQEVTQENRNDDEGDEGPIIKFWCSK